MVETAIQRLPAKAAVTAALLLSLGGTLFGLAGLLMWGIRAAEVVVPDTGNAPDWLTSIFPYATLLNFGLMATITVLGLLNLLLASRPQEFLGAGWKRWVIQSIVSLIAAAIFLNATNVA
ncbi:hypothetical protein INR77_10965 [Erythrobacter sp. SCSIO 43205]|uniref:hypothetical protein n=1 Tax=Erythrobacter sp. SCSIO 43205 TaxID=2779361 RepID=UPI001CAA0BDB|nr:hypothetical protein [Erythrobacter sp. SCSIO 43205]UAB77328.1 hypothetical protein INR77_10965 [Erythrobacter sp. SCSIO 43205]